MSFNKITVVGNLGRSVELRYLPDGTPVASFPMATNDKRKDKDGNVVETAIWFKVTVFGRQAETCAQYLDKGRQVYIDGVLRVDEWLDKENQKRYTLEVKASSVQFIDRAPEGQASAAGAGASAVANTKATGGAKAAPVDDDDSGIPF